MQPSRLVACTLTLALICCACGETERSAGDGEGSTTSTSRDATSTTTSTIPSFPGSPTPSAEALDQMAGLLASWIIQPATAGIRVAEATGDPVRVLTEVDPERLEEHVEALVGPRHAGAPDELRAAGAYLAEQLASVGYEVREDPTEQDGVTAPIVSARLAGTACASRVLVLAAHYDAPEGSPGADANASGVAALLEVARVLRDHRAAFSLELVGLPFGEGEPTASRAHLDDLRGDPVGFLALDRVGVTRDSEDEASGLQDAYLLMIADPAAEYLARVFGVAAATYLPDFWAWAVIVESGDAPWARESDHTPWVEADVPALLLTDTGDRRDDRIGTRDDEVGLIDVDFLANSTRATLAGIEVLGSLDSDADDTPDACQR